MNSKIELKSFIKAIPIIKKIVAKKLNQINKTSHNEEYWWFISGLYACNIWRIVQLHSSNKININDFISNEVSNKMYHFDFLNRLDSSWIDSKDIEPNIEEDLEEFLGKSDYPYINISYKELNFNKIKFYDFNSRYINYFFKLLTKISSKKKEKINIKFSSELELFESLFLYFLPEDYYILYPKLAEPIAKILSKFFIKSPLHTFNGFELRIFDQMMISFMANYKNKNDFKIITVGHGFGSGIGFGEIYYMTSSQFNYSSYYRNDFKFLSIPKKLSKKNNFDVLIIAPSNDSPARLGFSTFFSENNHLIRNEEYKEIINIANCYINLGLKIKIRYKRNDAFRSVEEEKIDMEKRPFEESFQDYQLIVQLCLFII